MSSAQAQNLLFTAFGATGRSNYGQPQFPARLQSAGYKAAGIYA
ncbi:hypothetical protein ACFS6H_01085 [Terrimonas rubra]|uniref:Uncharacterized protein n=1 Tax=Terrimonas rubra TaxID=1035890 RepID=A0ABW6A1E1_9BACT